MADSGDSSDPERRKLANTKSTELEKFKEDTVQIFDQFVRLHGPRSSNPLTTDGLLPDSPTTAPLQQCLQTQESSKNTTVSPSTLPRQKSREATRKDAHPKAVHSTRPPAQIVSSHHCSVAAEQAPRKPAGNQISPSRPEKLCLAHPAKHKRMPSSQSTTGSDSSGKTTPAQAEDPPIMSPEPELASYPQMSAQIGCREGLVHSAEHVGPRSIAASCTTSQERGRHYASAEVKGDPHAVKARMIADRLKIIGDEVEDEHFKSKLEELTLALQDLFRNNNITLQDVLLVYTQRNLSWRKVAELFKLLCRAMETTNYDQFSLIDKVWYCLSDSVVPWILDRGGWGALPRETEACQINTPNIPRRPPPLTPTHSEPVLIQCCQLSYIHRAGTIPAGGRKANTPQMIRHHPHEQSAPCLPRDCSNSQHSQPDSGRSRLWSLTESGNFKREGDGVEDTERCISELDMMVNFDEEETEEAFGGSQEEIEGENQQLAEQTLTIEHLQSGIHASAYFSNPISSPMIVSSPHSSSQLETLSMDDFHTDSGIEISSLSLSCSPGDGGISFMTGGANYRPQSSVNTHIQTSLTSLSSTASASPIHTSPSSRKNSSNESYFSNKSRQSSGSLKEFRPKHSGESPQCHRTGSLTNNRSHSRHRRMTAPTEETPSKSAGSKDGSTNYKQ